MIQVNHNPFHFLHGILNILIIDDMEQILDILEELFADAKIYSTYRAKTCKEAEDLIKSGKRFHLCLLDLGISDIGGDDLYLLKQYAKKIPFVIFTSREVSKKAFACSDNGAKELLKKSEMQPFDSFLNQINQILFENLINPKYLKSENEETIQRYLKVLHDKNPKSVDEWAKEVGVNKSGLRKICKQRLNCKTKNVLFVYRLFGYVFNFYEKIIAVNYKLRADYDNEIINDKDYQKMETYFLFHKKEVLEMISL